MGRVYVLFRCDGDWPSVEHLGAFTRISLARTRAHELEGELDWREDRAQNGLLYVVAEDLPSDSKWEAYGIVQLAVESSD